MQQPLRLPLGQDRVQVHRSSSPKRVRESLPL
jgi:hypothetical protein